MLPAIATCHKAVGTWPRDNRSALRGGGPLQAEPPTLSSQLPSAAYPRSPAISDGQSISSGPQSPKLNPQLLPLPLPLPLFPTSPTTPSPNPTSRPDGHASDTMPLQHIHVASALPSFPKYGHVAALQSRLQQRLLDYKASLSSPTPLPAPDPVVLSFTPEPTFTLGRRQTTPLTPHETARLRAPLDVTWRDGQTGKQRTHAFAPAVHHAPRGGLATYHGPGQVVLWPVVDLHSPLHPSLSVRDYAHLLERTTIAALRRLTDGQVQGFTTCENPGVWVRHDPLGAWNRSVLSSLIRSSSEAGTASDGVGNDDGGGLAQPSGEERKIAALGVHLRRHVSGLGVAVNVSMPVTGPESSNPWARIVACGLEDKKVTSVGMELWRDQHGQGDWVAQAKEESLPGLWASMFASLLYKGELPETVEDGSALVHKTDFDQVLGPGWEDTLDQEDAHHQHSPVVTSMRPLGR